MTVKTAKAPAKKTKTTTKSAVKSAPKPKLAPVSKPEIAAADKTASKRKPIDPRAWNFRLGLVLLAEAVAVVTAGSSKTVELTTQYLAKDTLASEALGKEVLSAASRHLVDVRLSWIIAAFLLVFGATYVLTATLWRKQYQSWLERGVNKLRWVGFGLGGGVAVAAVAMLSGITDVSTLGFTVGSFVLAGLLATAVELVGDGRKPLRRLLGLGAVLAVFLPWLTFVRTAAAVPMYNGTLPAFMYYVYAVLTLLLVAVILAVVMRVKRRGKWADTKYAELMFVVLGFVGATVLALQVFAGALQP